LNIEKWVAVPLQCRQIPVGGRLAFQADVNDMNAGVGVDISGAGADGEGAKGLRGPADDGVEREGGKKLPSSCGIGPVLSSNRAYTFAEGFCTFVRWKGWLWWWACCGCIAGCGGHANCACGASCDQLGGGASCDGGEGGWL
jgi:hypothetical protein